VAGTDRKKCAGSLRWPNGRFVKGSDMPNNASVLRVQEEGSAAKFTGWTFAAALVAAGLASPAMAQSTKPAEAAKKAVPPSHLPKPHKPAKQDKAKPPVTAAKR
ncbi:hypothetical protein, partial [Streptomyces sp. 067-1]|uniref:hypothetical protein n=2 Tax=Bacteria TaxID=2 RepID=UPI0039F461FE